MYNKKNKCKNTEKVEAKREVKNKGYGNLK
jgi:hypothetical protein